MQEIDKDALDPGVREYVEELEKALVAKASDDDHEDEEYESDEDEDEDEMVKALPEPLRKRFEELEIRAIATEEALRKEREEKELRIAVEKTRSWGHLPGLKPEEFAVTWREIEKAAPEAAESLEEILSKSATALRESALLKEIGSSMTSTASSPAGHLEALAKERAASSGKSYEEAYADTLMTPEGQQLYAQYHQKKGGN